MYTLRNAETHTFSQERINENGSSHNSKCITVDDIRCTKVMAVSAEQPKNFNALTGHLKFGVFIIDVHKCRRGKYLPIHKAAIRDMKFGCGYLLTGAT